MKAEKSDKLRLGIIVFGALAVLTALEYWISIAVSGPFLYLTIIALIKAGLIIYYFMHIAQLQRKEDH